MGIDFLYIQQSFVPEMKENGTNVLLFSTVQGGAPTPVFQMTTLQSL